MKHSLIETKDIEGHKKKSFEIMKGKDGDVYQIKGVSSDNKDDTFHVKERIIHKGINQHRTFKIKSSDLQNIIKESTRKIYTKDINKQKKIDIIKDIEEHRIKPSCKKHYIYTPSLIDQAIYKVIKIKSKKQNDSNIKKEINQDKSIKIEKLKELQKYHKKDNIATTETKNETTIKKTNKVISKKIETIINKDNVKEKSETNVKQPKKVRVKDTAKDTAKVIPKKTEKNSDKVKKPIKVTSKKIEKKNDTIKEKIENKVTEKVYEEAKIEKKKYQKKSKKINEDKNKESSKIIEKKEPKKSLRKKITKKDINHIKEIIEAKKDNAKMK